MGSGAVRRGASGLLDPTDTTALQARLPLGVRRARGPGRRGLFCSKTGGGGGRGRHSAWRAGPRAPARSARGEGSGPKGWGRAARTHLPFQLHKSLEYCAPAPPSSTASSSSSGGGPGPGAGGLGHSCPVRPPAARAAPRMLWLRLGRRPRVRAHRADPRPGAAKRPGFESRRSGRAPPAPPGRLPAHPRRSRGRPSRWSRWSRARTSAPAAAA